MADERERSGPTDEVGGEGGGPGEIELERTSVLTGSEATTTAVPTETDVREKDRQRERAS
ncbi:MAG: hypothetical protein JWL71_1034 [Acidobacteria bacterium]|jgi:hypothetical protein|nr:hypothetical protein [Acidobacteriota bacterium]